MMTMLKGLLAALKSKKGQGMVEYGLIIGLVAIVVIVALGLMGDGLDGIFNAITGELGEALPGE